MSYYTTAPTNNNSFAQVAPVALRAPLHPSLYLNTPTPLTLNYSSSVSSGPALPSDYQYHLFATPSRSQHQQHHQVQDYHHPSPTKNRRASHSTAAGLPYDIAQSPTRSRFQHDPDTSVGYSDQGPLYYAESPSRSSRTAARPRGTGEHHPTNGKGEQRRSSVSSKSHRASEGKRAQNPTFLPGVHGPMNHLRVPQAVFQATGGPHDARSIRSPVKFIVEGLSEPGVKVASMAAGVAPVIRRKDDLILEGVVEKKISVSFIWPGYESKTNRIPTHNGAVTRQGLLVHLCDMVRKWLEASKTRVQVDPRFENWALAVGTGINIDSVFITELVHRGGADWQIELWVAQERLY